MAEADIVYQLRQLSRAVENLKELISTTDTSIQEQILRELARTNELLERLVDRS